MCTERMVTFQSDEKASLLQAVGAVTNWMLGLCLFQSLHHIPELLLLSELCIVLLLTSVACVDDKLVFFGLRCGLLLLFFFGHHDFLELLKLVFLASFGHVGVERRFFVSWAHLVLLGFLR